MGNGLVGRLNDSNGLTTLRLIFAGLILVVHSWPLSGAGDDPKFGASSFGRIVVLGFFAISGYLIVGSRLRLSAMRFAWHRFLRIFPGYWTALLVVAFGFASIVAALSGERWTLDSAAGHIMGVWTTYIVSAEIPGTLVSAPVGPSWDGSTWTLLWNLVSYAAVGIAFGVPLFRRSPRWTAAVAGLCIVISLADGRIVELPDAIHPMFWLCPTFAAGAVLRLYGMRIPYRSDLALFAALAVAATAYFGELESLGPLPLAYLTLWLGGRITYVPRVDLSYGVYLYAFPVQQSVVNLGFMRESPWALAAVASVLVLPFAVASWFLVERHALRAKSWTPHWVRRGVLSMFRTSRGRAEFPTAELPKAEIPSLSKAEISSQVTAGRR